MASRISKECAAIQRGMGDKVANVTMSVLGFFAGYGFAFYWGWLYTLFLLVILPFAGLSGLAMGVALSSGQVEAMKAYA